MYKLYTSNIETIEAMVAECEKAEKTIDLEQFIFINDDYGKRLIDVCEKKAKEGVKVRFIWDAAGSFSLLGLNLNSVSAMKEKGIELVFFKTLSPSVFEAHNYKSWYFRDHRRSVIIDDKVAFTGSICIQKEKIEWRETNIMLQGPVVLDMKLSFERMWARAKSKKLRKNLPKPKYKNSGDFLYITNSPIPRHKKLYKEIVRAIREAEKSICMTTPYFVPTHHISKALKMAALRGVKVKILLPERSDNRFADLCAGTYFHNLLKSGVKIFLYKDHMIHKKTITVDRTWGSMGTMNIDYVSLLYNFEANIVSTNRPFIDELDDHFLEDLRNCEEMTQSKWSRRSKGKKVAGFFIRFIRFFF